MKKIVLKENVVIVFFNKSGGIELIRLSNYIEALSLFLSMDIHQVPFSSDSSDQYSFVVYQFLKECQSGDEKKELKEQLNNFVEIIRQSGYFVDCHFQLKRFVS